MAQTTNRPSDPEAIIARRRRRKVGSEEAVVAILPSGSFCGEECLAGHALRMSTVQALTEWGLIRLAKASTVRALHGGSGRSIGPLDREGFGTAPADLGGLRQGRTPGAHHARD